MEESGRQRHLKMGKMQASGGTATRNEYLPSTVLGHLLGLSNIICTAILGAKQGK